jgi:sigma54-dependent transcription regulator
MEDRRWYRRWSADGRPRRSRRLRWLAVLPRFDSPARRRQSNLQQWEAKKFEGHLRRLSREQTRLVDAYQMGIIELEELQERRAKIRQRPQHTMNCVSDWFIWVAHQDATDSVS